MIGIYVSMLKTIRRSDDGGGGGGREALEFHNDIEIHTIHVKLGFYLTKRCIMFF